MSKHAIGKKFHSQNKFIDTALFPEAQRNGTKKLYYSPPLPCPAALQSIFTREYRGSTHRARVEVNFQKKLRNNIFSSRTKKKPRYFVRYRGHNPYQDFKLFHFRTGSDFIGRRGDDNQTPVGILGRKNHTLRLDTLQFARFEISHEAHILTHQIFGSIMLGDTGEYRFR